MTVVVSPPSIHPSGWRYSRGGTGRPVLFVGCYLSGHVYDDIAPKLAGSFRVYAVTRRGVGVSERPTTGYDPQRRAADVLREVRAFPATLE